MKNPYEVDIPGTLVPIANPVGHPFHFVVLPPRPRDDGRNNFLRRGHGAKIRRRAIFLDATARGAQRGLHGHLHSGSERHSFTVFALTCVIISTYFIFGALQAVIKIQAFTFKGFWTEMWNRFDCERAPHSFSSYLTAHGLPLVR